MIPFLLLAQLTGNPTFQERLDAAPAGATLVFETTAFDEGTLTIRKPLTLVAPYLLFDELLLDGPGSGAVNLIGLTVYHPDYAPEANSLIRCRGFSEVRLIECDFKGRIWSVDPVYLELVRSFVWLSSYENPSNPPETISAPQAAVLFDGSLATFTHCARAFTYDPYPTWIDAPTTILPRTVAITQQAPPGGSFAVVWDTGAAATFVYWDAGYRPAKPVPAGGVRLLSALAVRLGTGPSGGATIAVPPKPELVGQRVVVQALTPSGFSPPAFGLIR